MSIREKRAYVLPIVGSGTREDPYRAKIPPVVKGGGSYVALIPSGPDGKPLHRVCLVKVCAPPEDLDEIDRMPEVAGRQTPSNPTLPEQAAGNCRKLDITRQGDILSIAEALDTKIKGKYTASRFAEAFDAK